MKPRILCQILLVNDESEFADFVQRGLSYEGYSVNVAGSAGAAWEVILDMMLPNPMSWKSIFIACDGKLGEPNLIETVHSVGYIYVGQVF